MPDIGHNMTEDILSDLENKLKKQYGIVHREMTAKLEKEMASYSTDLQKMKQDFLHGKISKKDFDGWKKDQLQKITQKQDMINALSYDLTNTDKIATAFINGRTPDVYALNYNFGTYQIESDIKTSTSFVLYDHNTVRNLVMENPDLLPAPSINVAKDMAWNKGHINHAITQGILQGESIPDIAQRLSESVGMSYRAAVRNARTATTGAQNAGRVASYERAQKMGIDLKQQWLSGQDNRVRHSHRVLDGEIIKIGERFSNRCRYPGDPEGPGYEVYNCRCTLVPVIKGFEKSAIKRDTEKYKEWEKGGQGFADWLEDQAAPDVNIMTEWGNKKMSNIYNMIKAQNTSDANKFYKALGKLGKPSDVWNKYLTGQLDADELSTFEGILKQYLPKNPDLDDHEKFLQVLKKKDFGKLPGEAYNEMIADATNTSHSLYTNIKDYWDDYLDGKFKNSKLDDILGYNKTSKTAEKISKEAQDSLDKLKFKAGEAMDVDKADNHAVNPLFDKAKPETYKNCQTCAFTYECRRQGYDVVAIPKDKKIKELFDLQTDLGIDQSKGWINKTTGKQPKNLLSHDINSTHSAKSMLSEIDNIVGNNGERYTISIRWNKKPPSSHVINLDRTPDGKLRLIDNQPGTGHKNKWVGDEVEDYLANHCGIGVKSIKAVYRVDDCVPNAKYFNALVTDGKKIKINLPDKVSDLTSKQYSKVSTAAKAVGEKPADYYKKYKLGLVDDKDLDDIFNASKSVKPAAATKTSTKKLSDDIDAFLNSHTDSVAEPIWLHIEEKVKYEFMNEDEYWKYYVKGKIKDKDLDDMIEKLGYKLPGSTTKPAAKVDELTKIKKDMPGSLAQLAAKDEDLFDEIFDIVSKNTPGGMSGQYYKKWLKGEVLDPELDDVIKKKYGTMTTKPAVKPAVKPTTASSVDFDAVKNKKVTQVFNEIKDDFSSKEANAFYKELKDIGKKDGLTQAKVWTKYVNGQLDADDVAKIEKHLGKKYVKAKPVEPEVDLFKLADKKVSHVYNELKLDNVTEANKFWKELQTMGKPSKIWEKYLNGELTEVQAKKIDSYLLKKYSKGSTSTATKAAATKSDDLIKAEAKLKKAEDDLKKLPNKTYSGIWKDDVTLADYEAKKGTIKAKKIYYDDELDKLYFDPDYQSWLSDSEKKIKIKAIEKHLDELDEFEQKGKEYAKYQKVVNDAKKEVMSLQPTAFSSEAYSKEAKKNAQKFKNKTTADKYHRPYLDSIWNDLTDQEKYSIWEYTRNSHPINKSLSGYHDSWSRSSFIGFDKTDWGHEDSWRSLDGSWRKFGKNGHVTYHRAITDATKAIEKSSLPKNTYFVRGSDKNGLAGMIEGKGFMSFDDAKKILNSGDINKIKAAFEGQTIKNHAFTSTGIATGTGFGGEVKFEIYAPKGTHAIYAEPQSHFGDTSPNSLYKVGKAYDSVGSEAEVIFQRGTEFRITNIKKSGSGLTVEMEVVDQPNYFKYGDEDTFNNGATRHKK